MTIMTRLLRLWKADIHGVMDRIEDQGLLLQQHLREMENSLQQKEAQFRQLAVSKRRIHVELTAGAQEHERLESDLGLALRNEKDTIAKLLIRKQMVQQKHNEKLQQQHDTLAEEQKQLSHLLEEQRLQYEIFKIRTGSFTLRRKRVPGDHTDTCRGQSAGANSIDDHEIELELIRRKEQCKKDGRTT
jgi:phage shock protein A